MLEYKQRRAIKNLMHALFTSCVLAVAVVALITLNREPNLQSQMIPSPDLANSHVLTYIAEKDKTVLEQLQEKAEVEARVSSSNTYIQSINSVTSKGGEQWQPYIDGRPMRENPLTHTTRGGEQIEWRLE